MTYEEEMIQTGLELVEAIKKEIQIENVFWVWEKTTYPMRLWVCLNKEAEFTHISEWLKTELPTEFGTFILCPGNKILFIG